MSETPYLDKLLALAVVHGYERVEHGRGEYVGPFSRTSNELTGRVNKLLNAARDAANRGDQSSIREHLQAAHETLNHINSLYAKDSTEQELPARTASGRESSVVSGVERGKHVPVEDVSSVASRLDAWWHRNDDLPLLPIY